MNTEQILPRRRTHDLCKGRISLAEACYFISCSASRPESRLTQPAIANQIITVFQRLAHDDDISLLCATTMPDHIHLLGGLSGRLSISGMVGKFKTYTRTFLVTAGIFWQRNFFEHRLRPDELANNYARYIFLNPYRAGLIDIGNKWPYWVLGMDADFDFLQLLKAGKYPPPEWIKADFTTLGLNDGCLGHD